MQIDAILKNALALLDQTLIPGSESLKLAAAKNDIKTAIKAAQEARAQLEKQQEEIDALREGLEMRIAELRTLRDEVTKEAASDAEG